VGGCKKNEDSPAPPAVTLASSAALGNFLTDEQGNTLYCFGLDVNGSSTCGTAACAAEWPIFYASTVTVGPGLNAADFTTGTTAGGLNQTFYKGWPLYYFAAPAANGQNVREAAGETKGDGTGSVWYVVRPNYSVMVAMNAVVDKSTNKPNFKPYLIDPQGRTLYTCGKDGRLPATQPTNCTGGCATAWPVFYQANITVPSGLKASDFGTITRTDGPNGSTRLQTTYKGLPLHYFAPDNSTRGKAEGDGLPADADQWSVAMP